jgi:nicotinamide mononucleotide adenylyltransferase
MSFDWKKPTVQMLGRWQPWHDGHTELFKRAHAITGQVCIMIRIVSTDDENPFDINEVSSRISIELNKEGFTSAVDYVIIQVPNIVNVSYGRNVGYTFTEHDLGKEIHDISATKIRAKMKEEGTLES